MPEENDWILYAPYSDKTMLRNMLTFDLARRQGSYASRTVFCEVFLNGSYIGVYVLMEKIKRDDNRVDIKKLDEDDNAGDSITGGYILRVDKIAPDFIYGYDGWLSNPNPSYPNAMDITFQYYYPEPDVMTPEQKNYIKEYVTETEEVLIGGGFNDPETGYNNYLDVGSFVDQMILNEICKEVDAYRYSTYFYKHHVKDGNKLFAGPGWDYNLGYGNVNYWAPGINTGGWVYPDVTTVPWSIMYWWKRLMEDAYFRDLLKTRWVGLRQELYSDEALEQITGSMVSHLGFAIDRNYERWPILGQYVWPNYFVGETYEEDLDYFTAFLFDRVAWMDGNVPGNMLYPAAEISGNNELIHLTLSDDYFNRKVLKNKYFELVNAPAGISIDTVVYVHVSAADIFLTGKVTGNEDLQVMVSSSVINGFEDLLSNTLGTSGTEGLMSVKKDVTVFSAGKSLHLECLHPEMLPGHIELFTLTGQLAGRFAIVRSVHNVVKTGLNPDIYLLRLELDGYTFVEKIILK
jgi:hypothetical protein